MGMRGEDISKHARQYATSATGDLSGNNGVLSSEGPGLFMSLLFMSLTSFLLSSISSY